MALTNATTLADYGAGIGTQGTTLKVDATNKRVGVGTDSPAGPEGSLQVGTGITFFGNTGIVSAIGGKFSGDFTVGGTLTYEDVANIDAVGIITAQSGVSIADSIFHTGDDNTAIRFPGNDTFTVETSGSEALRIDGSQRFLMGRTSTAAVANRNSNIQLHSNDASEASITIRRFFVNTDDNAPPRLLLGRSGSNSDDFTVVADDNILGEITFAGADGTDLRTEAANIRAEVDGTPGSNDMPGRLVFTTNSGAASATERLRITSAGNIGIGTDDPNALLHVENNATNAVIARFESNMGTNNSRGISIKSPVSDSASEPFIFDTGNAYEFQCDSTNALHIKFNRNIGIGTDDPSRLLELAQSNSTAYSTTDFDKDYHVLKLRNYTSDKSVGMQFLIGGNGEAAITAHEEDADGSTTLAFGVRNSGSRAERMRIDSGGRLLVGATDTRTNVAGQTLDHVFEEVDGTLRFGLVSGTTNTSSPILALCKHRGTTAGSLTSVNSGDNTGVVMFTGSDGTNFLRSAQITSVVDGTPATNDMPGRLEFSTTADGGSSPTERMRIDSSGRVQVGGTADLGDQLLQIQGNTDAKADVIISRSGANSGNTSTLTFAPANNVTGGRIQCVAEEDFSTGANRTARLAFLTRKDGTLAEKMRLTSDGALQIGSSGSGSLTSNVRYESLRIGNGLIKKYYVVDTLDSGEKTRFTFTGTNRTSAIITIMASGSWTASNTANNHPAAQFISRVMTNSSGDSADSSTVTTPFAYIYSTSNYTFTNSGSFGYTIDIANPTGDSGVTFSYEVTVQSAVATSKHKLSSTSTV